MRIALFTVSLPELTPREAADALASMGYDGVEWRVKDLDPGEDPDGPVGFWSNNRCTIPLSGLEDDAPQLRAMTERAGLAMPALGTYVRSDDPEGVARALRAAAALGAGRARVNVAYDSSRPYAAAWADAREQYAQVASIASDLGVKALVELHHAGLVPSASAAVRLLEGLDPESVGVIHDVGNLVREGHEEHGMGLQILGPYLAHVHVKNAAWYPVGTREDGSTVWEACWAALRDGMVNLGAYLETLRTHGYDGWISLEDFSTGAPGPQRAENNLAYLRRLMATTPSVT